MKYIVIRHGQTDANRLNRITYGLAGAPLNEAGISQAKLLRDTLISFGIRPGTQTVAVSELIRTRQTAELAGFTNIRINSMLNEVNTGDPENTLQLVAKRMLPPQAILAANKIIAKPPKQKVWITHGLVIAALEYVLNIKNDNFIANYCEIREIEL